MVQLELPLVYPGVHQIEKSPEYKLPPRWKAVFVLLLIYGVILSTITYVKATQTPAETDRTNAEATLAQAETTQIHAETALVPSGAASVKMTATVAGWYDVEEIDNANILVKTNMKVWVNGREFIRCDDCGQRTTDPSLLNF